jgi:hypothetical protein
VCPECPLYPSAIPIPHILATANGYATALGVLRARFCCQVTRENCTGLVLTVSIWCMYSNTYRQTLSVCLSAMRRGRAEIVRQLPIEHRSISRVSLTNLPGQPQLAIVTPVSFGGTRANPTPIQTATSDAARRDFLTTFGNHQINDSNCEFTSLCLLMICHDVIPRTPHGMPIATDSLVVPTMESSSPHIVTLC